VVGSTRERLAEGAHQRGDSAATALIPVWGAALRRPEWTRGRRGRVGLPLRVSDWKKWKRGAQVCGEENLVGAAPTTFKDARRDSGARQVRDGTLAWRGSRLT
jgi:hypothetical protein